MTKRRNIRAKILARDGYKCALCGKDCSKPVECGWKRGRKDGAHVDHVGPLWLTGDDSEENQRVVCEPCHKAKTAEEAALRAKCKRKRRKHERHKARMRAKGGHQ